MFRLLRYFSIASAVALIAVTFALVYLYRDNAMEGLVVSAEGQNITLARSLANILWPRFSHYVMTVPETDGDKLRARPETAQIDEAVMALTAGLPVLKVKIYNLDGRTIYSSQPSQIGADKSHNPGFLKSARAGKPASKFSFRENFSAFSGKVFNRSLVESYLPIWGDDDAVEGVLEIYTDVTPLVAMINRSTDRLTVGLLITFALLYGVLFVIVRRADQILKRQYADRLESEERFRAIVNNSPTKIHIKDAEGRYILVNPVAEKLFGFTDEEARGKSTYDLFPKEVADAFTAHDRAVMERGEMVEEEEKFTREDGEQTYLTVKFPIPDAHGGVAGIAAIGTDITERKEAEQEITKKSALLETTLQSMSQGISVYDADLKLAAFNQKIIDLTDFPPGFLRLGMPYEEIARFKAERGDYGSGDVDEHVRKRVRNRRERKPNRKERTWPNGRVSLYRRDVLPDGGYVSTHTDITERKQAEKALREGEELLWTVLDNLPVSVSLKDREGRYELINKQYTTWYGLTNDEARGRAPDEILDEHAETRAGRARQHRDVLASGKVVTREDEKRRADGTLHFVVIKKFPVVDSHGDITSVGSVSLDITERKRAEKEIAEKSALLETTFESMTQGIRVLDSDLRLVAFNRHYVDLIDFPPGFIRLGMDYEEITRFNAERGVYGPVDVEDHVDKRALERQSDEVVRRETKLPSGLVVAANHDPLPDGGYVTTYTDITERKRAEKEIAEKSALLETTFESMTQGISVYDADLKLVAVNQQYLDLMDFPPGFIRLGMSYEEIARFKGERGDYGPGEVGALVKAWVAAMREGNQLQSKFTTPDGSVFVMWRAPMPGGGIISTFTDITEQERAKTEMMLAKEQAELANRTKSEFLANMSHELRTPLNAILGFSELMGNATLGPLGNPKYEEYTKDINDSGRHLLALIQDLLDLSKIEAGKLELDEEDIDVAMATRSCMVLVKERARNGGVKLRSEIPEGQPALHADQRMLKQILVNLLSNAVKFTPAGGEVTLKAWSRPDSGYVFQVIDSGIGIALEDIPTALSPFGQVESDLNRKYEGTGLGLPLTKSLVEMHGGSLDLQSEVGVGTTVTVRFPKERIVYVSKIEATGTPVA